MRKFLFLALFAIPIIGFSQQYDVKEANITIVEDYVADYRWDGTGDPPTTYAFDDGQNTCAAATDEGQLDLLTCADIGTAGWTATTVTVANGTSTGQPSSGNPSCGSYCTGGGCDGDSNSWINLTPEAGVDGFQIDLISGSVGGGFSDMYVSVFQGDDCTTNFSEVGCGKLVEKISGSLYILSFQVNGLDDTKDIWLMFWSDGDKDFEMDFEIAGFGNPPANDDCSGATNSTAGCNLGATPDSPDWTTPSTALGAGECAGGTWYSNENTVFYSFTADGGAATLEATGTTCNGGGGGTAQMAVFANCGCVGTYTAACYEGCSVGAGTLSMIGLTGGQTYIIAVDGNAGAACKWNFSESGTNLPINLINFNATLHKERVYLNWSTASEENNDYFVVEKSIGGEFFAVASVESQALNGTSNRKLNYETLDLEPFDGISFYRLKQVDYDGNQTYSKLARVAYERTREYKVYPNPFQTEITIEGAEGGVHYEFTGITGRVLAKGYSENGIVDVSNIENGVLFLTIYDDLGQTTTHKLVKN